MVRHLWICVCLVVLGVVGSAADARAGGFALIAGGDEAKQPVVETELGPWLQANGHPDVKVGTDALPRKQIDQVVNCFILAEQGCVTPVVSAAGLDGLLFVMVEIERDPSATGDRIKVTGWLFGKGGAPIAAQSLFCNDCRNDTLKPKLEELARLLFVAAASGAGRLSVVTRPAGAAVLVDGEQIGVTPITHGLREGPHTITIELAGHETVTRKVQIKNDGESPIDVDLAKVGTVVIGGGGSWKKPVGYGAIAVGGAALVAGGALILLDPRCAKGSDAEACAPTEPTYTSTQLPGIAAAAAGAVILAGGVYLVTHAGPRRAAPVAVLSSGGATFGLAGTF